MLKGASGKAATLTQGVCAFNTKLTIHRKD